jgi:hemolysin-activating ACP:hemolysin acyltransferase
MKKFLAVYLGSPAAMDKWAGLSEAAKQDRQKEGIKTWSSWGERNSKMIVDIGAPLGKTKKVSPSGISDSKNQMTAYTLVEAESHEAAAKLFLNHPHFEIFPGDSIEIMECLPLPG